MNQAKETEESKRQPQDFCQKLKTTSPLNACN